MKILFACGGTAGHINPALAIADILKRKITDLSVVFVGTHNGMENRLVSRAGYPIRHISVEGLKRSLSLKNVRAGISLFRSFREAKAILKAEEPDLAVGTGGYVCYPILRVASSLGIPTVLHESNARAGIAAKLLAKHTDLALINFPSAASDFNKAGKTVVSGNPLRRGFYTLTRETARKRLGIADGALYLVVFGGSLGAKKLNETFEETVPRLLSTYPNLKILHAVGQQQNGGDTVANRRYERRIYIDDMPTHLTAADAVVCRAGAMTVSEIAAAGVPSILIPYPRATGDHQTKNASEFAKAGAAILLPDADLTPDVLFERLSKILTNGEERRRMREATECFRTPDCESVILREVLTLCPRFTGG